MNTGSLLRVLRPKHYIKNVFVFLPMVFSLRVGSPEAWIRVGLSFAAFCLVASAVYVLNDIHDREADRRHPRKKFRPIAAGELGVEQAWRITAAAFAAGMLLACASGPKIAAGCLAYFLLNILYTYQLKQHPILDVTLLATGFVLRLFVGAWAGQVELSTWIVMMTFLLALFLAFAKRRDDLLMSLTDGVPARRALAGYNLELLNSFMVMMGTVLIVCYIMYTVSPDIIERAGSQDLYLTGLFVILGIFRYLQITFVDKNSGSPTDILWSDRFLQSCVAGWLCSFLFILVRARLAGL